MGNCIIIIAPAGDLHALTVAYEARQIGACAIILDLADFPERWRLSLHVRSGASSRYFIDTDEHGTIVDDQVSGVWYRRSSPFRIPQAIDNDTDRRFAGRECGALIEGWLLGLGDRVINPVEREYAAGRKAYQLHRAALNGLKIPETVISNSPERVAEFAAPGSRVCIHKPLTAARNSMILFTQMMDEEAYANLNRLVSGPSIFQEAILGGLDVRVTIVDKMLFAASLHIDQLETLADWRTNPNVQTSPHLLPPAIEASLYALHADLGLRYGAYDLRSNSEGEYHFLEVNTAGQYLWVETDAGHRISEAIANALVTGSRH